MYKCSLCDYTSYYKTHVKDHHNKKNRCSTEIPEIVEIYAEIYCIYCNKKMVNKTSLNRHIKICKLKQQSLEQENKNLREKLAKTKSKPNTINIINNNNVNINLTPWNNPYLPDDIEKYYSEAVKKIFLAVPTLIKFIHFNEEHPENHNICIRNARSKVAKVFNGKEWESIDEDRLINTLINDYESMLTYFAEEKYTPYITKMNIIKKRDTEEKVYDDLQVEIKRVIHDKNYMIRIKN